MIIQKDDEINKLNMQLATLSQNVCPLYCVAQLPCFLYSAIWLVKYHTLEEKLMQVEAERQAERVTTKQTMKDSKHKLKHTELTLDQHRSELARATARVQEASFVPLVVIISTMQTRR